MRVLVPILLVCAASSLQAQRTTRRCTDTPIDSTIPSSPVYQECHVERKAKLRSNGQRPQFSPTAGGAGASCYRVSFEFVVDTTGKPEVATVRRMSSTDPTYADAVEATLGTLQYEPARLDATAVRQVARYESRLAVRTVVVSSSPGSLPGGIPGGRPESRRPIC